MNNTSTNISPSTDSLTHGGRSEFFKRTPLFSNSLPIQTIPSSLFMDIFQRKGNQVVKKSNLKEASALLFPAVALTAMDTAPPPNREITTCVLARTTPFLLTVRIHPPPPRFL